MFVFLYGARVNQNVKMIKVNDRNILEKVLYVRSSAYGLVHDTLFISQSDVTNISLYIQILDSTILYSLDP